MLTNKTVSFNYEQGACSITRIVTGGEWKQNAYIVTHKSSLNTIVIDPGDEADVIAREIETIGSRLTHILLTHSHHDHVGAVSELSQRYDIDCKLHNQDRRLLMQAPIYALTFAKKNISKISRFETFEELRLNDKVPSVRSIHTPGHTKGSVCYVFDGFVFTGDTLLNKLIGRTDLPGSSLTDLYNSVTNLLVELHDEAVLFPGHGNPWIARDAKIWWGNAAVPPQHYEFDNIR